MSDNIEISILYDFYGHLLNDAQQEVVELSVNDDLSLSEVAEILNISRQGVRDNLNRAKSKLIEFEEKLGLYKQTQENRRMLEKIVINANEIKSSVKDNILIEKSQEIQEIATLLLRIGG